MFGLVRDYNFWNPPGQNMIQYNTRIGADTIFALLKTILESENQSGNIEAHWAFCVLPAKSFHFCVTGRVVLRCGWSFIKVHLRREGLICSLSLWFVFKVQLESGVILARWEEDKDDSQSSCTKLHSAQGRLILARPPLALLLILCTQDILFPFVKALSL